LSQALRAPVGGRQLGYAVFSHSIRTSETSTPKIQAANG
jgi:hypothetical protein